MKKDEVIEIAKQSVHDKPREDWNEIAWVLGTPALEYFANEVERRTLERAAQVCEASPSYDWHKFACEAATAIRALKEEI